MWQKFKDFMRGAAKAVWAFAAPTVAGMAAQWLSDLETALPGLISGALSALFAYVVKNGGPKANEVKP